MQRDGHSLIPHGTLQSYDPNTEVFTAFMDFQQQGEPVYIFTPVVGAVMPLFTDQNGLIWELIR